MKRWTIEYEVDGRAICEVEAETEEEARAAFDRGEWAFSHYSEENPGALLNIREG